MRVYFTFLFFFTCFLIISFTFSQTLVLPSEVKLYERIKIDPYVLSISFTDYQTILLQWNLTIWNLAGIPLRIPFELHLPKNFEIIQNKSYVLITAEGLPRKYSIYVLKESDVNLIILPYLLEVPPHSKSTLIVNIYARISRNSMLFSNYKLFFAINVTTGRRIIIFRNTRYAYLTFFNPHEKYRINVERDKYIIDLLGNNPRIYFEFQVSKFPLPYLGVDGRLLFFVLPLIVIILFYWIKVAKKEVTI